MYVYKFFKFLILGKILQKKNNAYLHCQFKKNKFGVQS